MRLTVPLALFKLPNGHIFRGKNRLVKKVTGYDVASLRRDFEREEANMFYLRHPYLTLEQSKGHSRALNKEQKWFNKFITAANKKFSKHRTLEEELSHLKVKENWEFKAGSQI